jgi:hypothetical protein
MRHDLLDCLRFGGCLEVMRVMSLSGRLRNYDEESLLQYHVA